MSVASAKAKAMQVVKAPQKVKPPYSSMYDVFTGQGGLKTGFKGHRSISIPEGPLDPP